MPSLSIDQINALRPLVGLEPPQWLSNDRVAFVSSLGGQSEVWAVPAAGGFPVRLTVGMGGVRFLSSANPRVSPDGTRIAYISEKGGSDAELWVWSAADGQSRQMTRLGAHINAFSWSPDGQRLVFSANRYGVYDIYTADLTTRQTRRLTSGPRYEVYPVFTPDGRHILFVRLDQRWVDHDIVAIPAEGGPERVVVHDEGMFDYHYGKTFGYPLPTPDGRSVVFRSYRSGWLNYWQVRTDGGAPEPLLAEAADQSEAAFAPDGASLAYIANENGTLKLCLLDLATRQRRVLVGDEPGVCALPSWSPDGRRIAFLFQTPTETVDVWTVDVVTGERTRLTDGRVGVDVQARLVTPEKITYTSFDGTPITAYLYPPLNREPGRRYPSLLIAHGGPASQFLDGFYGSAQFFASQGYVVIQPNVRGSTGYGQAFETANFQDYGGGDLKDCVAAVDYLKTLEYVDPARMAITGVSYGGYLSMAAPVFTAPGTFQAAIAASGYSSQWDRMQLGGGDEQERRHKQQLTYRLGDLPESEEVFKRVSPLYYAAQAHTPLFVLHGEGKHPNTPSSRKFVQALEKEYKTVQYKTYPGEHYYVQSPANTRQMWLDMLDFLARFL